MAVKQNIEAARFHVAGQEIGSSKEYTMDDLTIGHFDGFFHMSVQQYTDGYRAMVYFQMASTYDYFPEGEVVENSPEGIDLTWAMDFQKDSDIFDAWDRHYTWVKKLAYKEQNAQAIKIARFTLCAHSVKIAAPQKMKVTIIENDRVSVTYGDDTHKLARISAGGKIHKGWTHTHGLGDETIARGYVNFSIGCNYNPIQHLKFLPAGNISRYNLCERCFPDEALKH